MARSSSNRSIPSLGQTRSASPGKPGTGKSSPLPSPQPNTYAPSIPTRMGPPSTIPAKQIPKPSPSPSLSASTSMLPQQGRLPTLATRRHSIRTSIDLTGLPIPLPRTPSSSQAPLPASPKPNQQFIPQPGPQSILSPVPQSVPASLSQISPPSRLPPLSMPKPASRISSVNLLSQVAREDPEALKASTSSPAQISPTSPTIPVCPLLFGV